MIFELASVALCPAERKTVSLHERPAALVGRQHVAGQIPGKQRVGFFKRDAAFQRFQPQRPRVRGRKAVFQNCAKLQPRAQHPQTLYLWQRLRDEKLQARLLLQVHDELIVEAPENEVEQVKRILKEEMEQVVSYSVPLTAEVGTGKTWLEAH